MQEIVTRENPMLRNKAATVSTADIGTPELTKILNRMREALHSQADGVAIAAPQIGVPLRIFVVAGFIFKKETDPKNPPDRVFINPEIMTLSKEKQWLEEGCLSVRRLYGEVSRSKKAKIKALDETGKKFTVGASGLLAQIFQHEIDHLEGILFTDHARNVREIPPEEQERILQEMAKKHG